MEARLENDFAGGNSIRDSVLISGDGCFDCAGASRAGAFVCAEQGIRRKG
jgi:hypothetical protein